MQARKSSVTPDIMPVRPRRRLALISSVMAVAALATMTACSGGAPTPPSQPTVQAAATQAVGAGASAAGTAQAVASPAATSLVAAASPAAATLQAAASPAAATAQAGASGVAATSATIAGTVVAAIPPLASPSPSPSPAAARAPIRIADASLADSTPWVSIQNTSTQPVDLGGWHLQVGSASTEIPDDAVVEPGSTLTLHAGDGTNSGDEVYLGNAGDLLASAALPGASVRLTDQRGQTVTEATVPRF